MEKVGIIGMGAMGKHLKERLESRGVEVSFVLGREAADGLQKALDREAPKAVFITISTRDTGEAARDYILTCVRDGVPVITSEKGALAYHSEVLKPYQNLIGASASCGGGTRMMKYVAGILSADPGAEINVVLNGTLNYVFDEMSRGRSLAEACNEAQRLGYAEPGASDPLSLINGELKDVLMKTCVFFNSVLAQGTLITPKKLGHFAQTREDLAQISQDGGDSRLIVSFSNQPAGHVVSSIGQGFVRLIDGWIISGLFVHTSRKEQRFRWLPDGVGNAVHIAKGPLGENGIYTLSGPGAGYGPTTSAMLADFEELTQR